MYFLKHVWKQLAVVYRSLYFPPLIIAVAILIATGATWHSSRRALNQDILTAMNSHIGVTERAIRNDLQGYEEVLRGGVGFFRGSSEVTQDDWRNYISTYDVHTYYPSAQTIGFIKELPAVELAAFVAYMQSQIPDFQVTPAEPARDVYAPLTYAEAIAIKGTPSYGLDMYSIDERKPALLEARDTGKVTLTKRVILRPSGETRTYPGFIMFTPYYALGAPTGTADERRAALEGYTYASFRSDLFFNKAIEATDANNRGFRITVAGNKDPLYVSPRFDSLNKRADVIRVSRTFTAYGRSWNMEYAFDRVGIVSDVQLRRPSSVLLGGIFTSILIALVVFLLLRSRAQELAAQKEQAVELAKDELLSLASHQLRTPATGVKQYIGMVLQGFAGKVPKDQKALLEKAYASNDRQLSIINEILHLAKIDSGRIVLARQETDVNALVEDIVNEQQPDVVAAGHTLTVHLPKRPLILNIDGHTLRMAIENVLSNAIKYTPKGGAISVRLQRGEDVAYLRIRDTGIGIAPGDIDKLFKQFSRLPNEMSLRVGGTGIGLYLARHLVELHGGRIEVASTVGKGSTFTIILPLKGGRDGPHYKKSHS